MGFDLYHSGRRLVEQKSKTSGQPSSILRALRPYGMLGCTLVAGTFFVWWMTHRERADAAADGTIDVPLTSFVEVDPSQSATTSRRTYRRIPVLLAGHTGNTSNGVVAAFEPLPSTSEHESPSDSSVPLNDFFQRNGQNADDVLNETGVIELEIPEPEEEIEFSDIPGIEPLQAGPDPESLTGFGGRLAVRSPLDLGPEGQTTFTTNTEPTKIGASNPNAPLPYPRLDPPNNQPVDQSANSSSHQSVEQPVDNLSNQQYEEQRPDKPTDDPKTAPHPAREDLINQFREHTAPTRTQLQPDLSQPTPTPVLNNQSPLATMAEPTAMPLINLNHPTHGESFWWETSIQQSLFHSGPTQHLTLEDALMQAVQLAPELQVLQADHAIAEQVVRQQEASFDWTTFLQSSWNRDNNPVGSQLDGTQNRLTQSTWSMRGGVRRFNQYGGEFQLSQELGYLNSNSSFIQPNNQGTGRLSFDYSHPLLRQQGIVYNTSQIALAEINREIAHDNLMAGIEDHLLNVASAYWTLVLDRGRLVQNRRALQRTQKLFQSMSGRKEVDVRPSQIARAESSLLQNKSMVIEAAHDARRSQEALLRLIYGSNYTQQTLEIIPTSLVRFQVELSDPEPHVDDAVRNRSEVQAVLREIRSATLQKQLAANEILPQLNLVLSGYTAGLRGNSDIAGAVKNQFNSSEPGFGVGFEFELPYRNRAAKAAADQRRIAVDRFRKQFEAVVANITLDVRSQLLNISRDTRLSQVRKDALVLTGKELDYLTTRFKLLIDGRDVADLYFGNLVQTQQRFLSAEFSVLQARVQLAQSQMQLLRGKGMMHSLVASSIIPVSGPYGIENAGEVLNGAAEPVFQGEVYDADVFQPYRIRGEGQPGHSGVLMSQ